MKLLIKISVTISIFLLIHLNVKGQDITIDFEDKKMIKNGIEELKEGESFLLIIENINLNLYKVEVIYKDTFKTKPLEMPTFTSFVTEDLLKLPALLGEMQTSGFIEIAESEKKEFEKLRIIIQQEIQVLAQENGDYLKNLKEAEVLITKVYRRMLNLHRIEKGKGDNSITDTEIQEIFKIQQSFLRIKIKASNKQSAFQKKLDLISNEVKDAAEMKSKISEINEVYKQLHISLDTTIIHFGRNKVFKLLRQLTYMENNKSYRYTSLPIPYNGNKGTLTYKIIPRDSNSLLQSYESFPMTFPNEKRYYAVGLSFYGANLFDKTYAIAASTLNDTTTYRIIQEDDLDAEIGMASLVRFGKKVENYKNLGIHITFGPGVFISNKIKPRFLLGVGISSGSKHNFSLDIGLITGYVDVLSKVYSTDDNYKIKPETLVVPSLKGRAFGAIGYFYKF